MNRNPAELIIKRNELYEQVWKIPMTKLAKQFLISDAGLAKICKKLKIPRPARGYWSKVEHGKRVHRLPLPILNPGEPEEFTHVPSSKAEAVIELVENSKGLPQTIEKITVPDRLVSPLPLIKETRAVLRQIAPDKYGMLSTSREGCLVMRIGPDNTKRGLLLLDAILKEFARLGFHATMVPGEKIGSQIEIAGELLPFMLLEEARRIDHVMTSEEKSRQKEGRLWSLPNWDFVPSGFLSFVLDTWGAPGVRKQWSDSSRQRLEEKIKDIVNGSILVAHVLKNERTKREEEDRKRAEDRKRQEETEKKRAAEEARRRDLERQAETWAKAQQLRAYIQAVESLAAEKQFPDGVRQWLEPWISWAKGYVDRLDPLRELRANQGA